MVYIHKFKHYLLSQIQKLLKVVFFFTYKILELQKHKENLKNISKQYKKKKKKK